MMHDMADKPHRLTFDKDAKPVTVKSVAAEVSATTKPPTMEGTRAPKLNQKKTVEAAKLMATTIPHSVSTHSSIVRYCSQ
mmetsp:Transcript_82009/g.160004  ORF Transcript_82009/g.160004 Transcript_82009/m.160004 type:complete len:80 (-) Transcript_82009:1050-1289(-)